MFMAISCVICSRLYGWYSICSKWDQFSSTVHQSTHWLICLTLSPWNTLVYTFLNRWHHFLMAWTDVNLESNVAVKPGRDLCSNEAALHHTILHWCDMVWCGSTFTWHYCKGVRSWGTFVRSDNVVLCKTEQYSLWWINNLPTTIGSGHTVHEYVRSVCLRLFALSTLARQGVTTLFVFKCIPGIRHLWISVE